MVDIPDIFAQPKSLESRGGSTFVEVVVVGPRGAPMASRKIRARARALAAAGLAPTMSDSIEDLTVGEIKALTKSKGKPKKVESNRLKKTTLHTVEVNRD